MPVPPADHLMPLVICDPYSGNVTCELAGIENALATFEQSPTIMQRFHKGRLFEHRYWDSDSSELKTMKGRVRLCPYFFVEQDRVKLRGALATIAPADKKFVHGMRDAILVPSRVETPG